MKWELREARATLAEARTEAQDLREQLAPARDFLAVTS